MGRPAIATTLHPVHGPRRRARLDALEVTQTVQDLGESVPLIAEKRTFVRAYLGVASGSFSVRGELHLAHHPHGPWRTISSTGTAALDPSRRGATLAQLRSRRDNAGYSLNFRLPRRFTCDGSLWIRLGHVRDTGTGRTVRVTNAVGTKKVDFIESPALRVHVLNLRYTTGSPAVAYAATANDLDHLRSWLRRAYPTPGVRFSSVTLDATAAWPFSSGQANAQVAAVRALDMAGGADPGTHYYGMVADGGGFMRGSAAGIPGTPDPSVVASGPTGPGTWGWDFDGSYGDWYGGHELGHTFGRFHPGFCGESHDDPAYPFTAGQLANSDDAFVGFDVGDSFLGLPVVALPGTGWHDVMTYCSTQWLSSYTYEGIRNRLVAEEALFPEAMLLAQDRAPADMNGRLVHVSGVVNLTAGTASIEHVTPLPGSVPAAEPPAASRLALRTRQADGAAQEIPVVFKPDLCRLPGEDETGLVDSVVEVEPGTTSIELMYDGKPVARYHFESAAPRVENIRVQPAKADGDEDLAPAHATLAWDVPSRQKAGAGRYVVQASTDGGATWRTLALGLTEPRLELDASAFGGAQRIRFRVLGTNGLEYTEVATEDLPVSEL